MLIRFFKENDLIGCGGDPQPIRLQVHRGACRGVHRMCIGVHVGVVIILNTISKRQDGSDLFRILHTKSFSKFTEASVYYVIAVC